MAGYIKRRDKSDNFTKIQNETLRNPNLSLKAKGLLGYLLSHDAKFEIRKTNIHKYSKDGYDSTNSAFKELEDNGYIKTVGSGRDEKGNFIGFDYEVDDMPIYISENQTKKEKVRLSDSEPFGIYRNGLPDAGEPLRVTHDKEEQVKEEQISITINSNPNKEEQERNLNINAETSSACVKDLFGKPIKEKPIVKSEYNGSATYKKSSKVSELHNYFKESYLTSFKEINGITDTWGAKSGAITYKIIDIIVDKTIEIKNLEAITNDEVKSAIDFFFYSIKNMRGPYFLDKFSLTNLYSNSIQVFVKIINEKNGKGPTTKQPGQRPGVSDFRFNVPTP